MSKPHRREVEQWGERDAATGEFLERGVASVIVGIARRQIENIPQNVFDYVCGRIGGEASDGVDIACMRRRRAEFRGSDRGGEAFLSETQDVSLVDRLVHNAEVIAIDGDSYRLKEATERADQRARQRRAPSS